MVSNKKMSPHDHFVDSGYKLEGIETIMVSWDATYTCDMHQVYPGVRRRPETTSIKEEMIKSL